MQVRGQLEVLMSASEELMACGDFMILLRAVLTLGNHLNEGTMRGSASGAHSTPLLPKQADFTACARRHLCCGGLIDRRDCASMCFAHM